VIGESGVGKTSLVQAGLVPRLKQYGFGIVRFSFHDDPLRSLAAAIEGFCGTELPARATGKQLQVDLVHTIENGLKKKRKIDRLLIIGDHLEQMFTISKVDNVRDRFVRAFYRLLDGLCPKSVTFLFCMRQDYLADLYDLSQHIPELYERQNTFKLYRLSKENGREVLEIASEFARMKLPPPLVEQILNDLCELGEGVIYPPYFQIVGYRLYAAANRQAEIEGDVVPMNLYRKLGGAERIINNYFDSFLDRYPQAQKPIVGQILEKMVTDYYTKKRVTRQHLASQLPTHTDLTGILDSLVRNRIVRRTLGEYELIHDCIAQRVVELVKQQTFLSPPVRKTLNFMEKNYQKPDIRSEHIALAAGVTAVHLASLFREQLGRTINMQLNTVRIGAAKNLLAKDRRPIAQIAKEVGFKTLSAFSRKFGELEGISALQYRKKLIAASVRDAS
jgi:AraC-like DNA-binding protein